MHLSVFRNNKQQLERSLPLCTLAEDCDALFDSDGCIHGHIDVRLPLPERNARTQSAISVNEQGDNVSLLRLCSV